MSDPTNLLAGRDVVQEAKERHAAKQLEEARRLALTGTTAALHQLEERARLAERLCGRMAAVTQRHAERVAGIDPGLRREIADQRRRELAREATKDADAIRRELAAELEAARAEAARLADARRVRRRARFDPLDPAADALRRLSWQMRLDGATPEALLDFAEEAAAIGDVALLGAVEEAIAARPALETGTAYERETVAKIREAIGSYEPEQCQRARKALAGVERAERELAEAARLLRPGARPSGTHQIREGLHARAEAQAEQAGA